MEITLDGVTVNNGYSITIHCITVQGERETHLKEFRGCIILIEGVYCNKGNGKKDYNVNSKYLVTGDETPTNGIGLNREICRLFQMGR